MMIDWQRLAACAVVSLGAHFALARGLEALPHRGPLVVPRPVEVKLVPPPEPDPDPPLPDPEPTKPPPVPHDIPTPKTKPIKQAPVANDTPPPPPAAVTSDTVGPTTNVPTFGVTMESTSQAGTGPALPIGNTITPTGTAPTEHAKDKLAEPVAAYEVTKMPLPRGRCTGTYTPEAKAAGIEGTVVLSLVVNADGTPREIKVVTGLGSGLTEAAIAALKACRFTPGQRDGVAVPVRIREFKIRFVLAEASN